MAVLAIHKRARGLRGGRKWEEEYWWCWALLCLSRELFSCGLEGESTWGLLGVPWLGVELFNPTAPLHDLPLHELIPKIPCHLVEYADRSHLYHYHKVTEASFKWLWPLPNWECATSPKLRMAEQSKRSLTERHAWLSALGKMSGQSSYFFLKSACVQANQNMPLHNSYHH